MASKGRHPKAPIAEALATVDRPGLDVEPVHKGHRWGVLVCTDRKAKLAIWSTPRVPEDMARQIRRFDRKHRHYGAVMSETHEFTLVIDQPLDEDEQDALFDAGCDDATPEIESERTLLHFTRRAPSLAAAIASAVLDVERAHLTVGGVGSTDLVDLPGIAGRVGRSRESIRLLAAGKRGPGGFPTERDGFYSWTAVRAWFAGYDPAAVGSPDADELDYDRLVAAADHVVRARALTHGHARELQTLLPA